MKKLGRLLVPASLALTMLVPMTSVPAAAQEAGYDKIAECLALLLTDPIEQARVCGDGEAGAARHAVTTPPPPPPAKPDDECDFPTGLMLLAIVECPVPT